MFDGGTGVASFSPVFFTGASNVTLVANVFRNRGANTVDVIADTTTKLVVSNNIFDGGYTIASTCSPAAIAGNIGGTTRTYLNAAPTTGAWQVGDVVYFTAPAAGGYVREIFDPMKDGHQVCEGLTCAGVTLIWRPSMGYLSDLIRKEYRKAQASARRRTAN